MVVPFIAMVRSEGRATPSPRRPGTRLPEPPSSSRRIASGRQEPRRRIKFPAEPLLARRRNPIFVTVQPDNRRLGGVHPATYREAASEKAIDHSRRDRRGIAGGDGSLRRPVESRRTSHYRRPGRCWDRGCDRGDCRRWAWRWHRCSSRRRLGRHYRRRQHTGTTTAARIATPLPSRLSFLLSPAGFRRVTAHQLRCRRGPSPPSRFRS